jgi:hypothetical protein
MRTETAGLKAYVKAAVLTSGYFLAGTVQAITCESEPTDMAVDYGEQVVCDVAPGTDTDFFVSREMVEIGFSAKPLK